MEKDTKNALVEAQIASMESLRMRVGSKNPASGKTTCNWGITSGNRSVAYAWRLGYTLTYGVWSP